MKLWWVHLEAMVATLMVFNNTRQEEDWERFRKVFKYSFDHVSIIRIDRNNSHKADGIFVRAPSTKASSHS